MVDRLCQVRYFPVQGLSGKPDDAEQARSSVTGSLLGPVQSRALGIGINEEDGGPSSLQLAGKVQRYRRLAGAALLRQDGDDHGSLARACGK
jgi:hypothetical protein